MQNQINDKDVENKINALKAKLEYVYNRNNPPDAHIFMDTLTSVNTILMQENKQIRPYDEKQLPGGLIFLKKDMPTIIVPDVHARYDFFLSILNYKDANGLTVLEKLALDKIQIVCVGDGFHAEARAFERWQSAFEEFLDEYVTHDYIDEEMKESLGVMEMVMETKIAFPDNFHFLKGNHENILNELGNGNYPFRKFSFEGQMVRTYIEKFYGDDFLQNYALFEKKLPIFAVGKNFLVSHAEPQTFYEKDDIINYRANPDLIVGFTWTDNDAAEPDSVSLMIEHYLREVPFDNCYYFGGHRPINNLYNTRANGKYVQIHNPDKFIIAYLNENSNIDLDKDIFELKK